MGYKLSIILIIILVFSLPLSLRYAFLDLLKKDEVEDKYSKKVKLREEYEARKRNNFVLQETEIVKEVEKEVKIKKEEEMKEDFEDLSNGSMEDFSLGNWEGKSFEDLKDMDIDIFFDGIDIDIDDEFLD